MANVQSESERFRGLAGKHILLVDDEAPIQAALSRYFVGLGCVVDAAAEVEEALAMVAHRPYDVAIVDLRLGPFAAAEGIEVLRQIRRTSLTTRVIVLSAFVSDEVESEVSRMGAAAILRKPQPLPELARLALALVAEG
jgi:CheY-like chemotaxis protein